MKLTLTNIKAIKRNSENPLEKYVCNYVINEWQDYDDKTNIFKDVLYHGCQSGVVGSLIGAYTFLPRVLPKHSIKMCSFISIVV